MMRRTQRRPRTEFAEKVKTMSPGLKPADDRAGFMSELKLRPLKTGFFQQAVGGGFCGAIDRCQATVAH
jgi:hypothetical protein